MGKPKTGTRQLVAVFTLVLPFTTAGGDAFGAAKPPSAAAAVGEAPLVVLVDGAGTVTSSPTGIACPDQCAARYAIGQEVVLAARPADGFGFAGWSEACRDGGACTLTIDTPTFVKATFLPLDRPPPLFRSDTDGDGVVDASDRCAETPRGAPPLRAGCSLADLLVDSRILLEPLVADVGEVDLQLGGVAAVRTVADSLDRDLDSLESAVQQLEQGKVCAADDAARSATAQFEQDRRGSAALIAGLEAAVLREPAHGGDADAKELRWAGLHYRQHLVDRTADEAASVQATLDTACRGIGARTVFVGRVAETLDAGHLIRLDDGTLVSFPEGTPDRPYRLEALWQGESVRIVARKTAQGPWVGESTVALGPVSTAVHRTPCISLRIAPAQDFSQPDPILQSPRGYEQDQFGIDNVLWLEDGTRVGASAVVNSPDCSGLKGRWSLSIDLAGKTVAPDLDSNDPPAPLPFVTGYIATMTVVERFQGSNCLLTSTSTLTRARRTASTTKAYPCPIVVKSTTTYPVAMETAGSYATAAYSKTVFHDPNEVPPQFLEVTGLSFLQGTIGSASFEAEGYKQVGTQAGGTLETIHEHESFALRSDGWYGAPLLFPLATIGVDHLAGLVWPRVVGTRHGYPFRYRASLPTLVTDLLPLCPGSTCFYVLPWPFPDLVSTAQGNKTPDPTASHCCPPQNYAFDFAMADKSTIYATRGGVVGDLVESNTVNANPCTQGLSADAPSNYVRVDHQDGTYSYYAHVDTNSVIPQIGDTVQRGDPLAKVDNIGRSCGPHLHYQVSIDNTKTIYGQTIPICFETFFFPILGYSPCYVPQTGDLLLSTNA
jgi:murein DD-endopeptidase MepM/ murein hydrolase activator NlpD